MAEVKKKCTKCQAIKPVSEFYRQSSSKDGLMYMCKACCSERSKKHYEKNSQKVRDHVKQYRVENPDVIRERKRKYAESHKELIAEYKKEYQIRYRDKISERSREYRKWHKDRKNQSSREFRKNHPDIAHARDKIYRDKHHDKCRENIRRWSRRNPDKVVYYVNKRRAIKNQCVGNFTREEFDDLCQRYGNVCLCCGKKKKLHADHIVPIGPGVLNTIDNIQPLCQSCNSKKRRKTIDYRINFNASIG